VQGFSDFVNRHERTGSCIRDFRPPAARARFAFLNGLKPTAPPSYWLPALPVVSLGGYTFRQRLLILL
jgi:hypothetical protein